MRPIADARRLPPMNCFFWTAVTIGVTATLIFLGFRSASLEARSAIGQVVPGYRFLRYAVLALFGRGVGLR
jgi:hypothetical protein